MPTEERFPRQFPTLELFDVPDPLSSLLEELRMQHAKKVAAEIIPAIAKMTRSKPR